MDISSACGVRVWAHACMSTCMGTYAHINSACGVSVVEVRKSHRRVVETRKNVRRCDCATGGERSKHDPVTRYGIYERPRIERLSRKALEEL